MREQKRDNPILPQRESVFVLYQVCCTEKKHRLRQIPLFSGPFCNIDFT